MKHAIFAATLVPLATPLWADIIPLSAEVTAATLYSEGATVTRSVPYATAAGSHELLITNLPESLDPLSVRVSLDGATLGAVSVRRDPALPGPREDSPEIAAAKADLERAQNALYETEDARSDVMMKAAAAEARIAYLASLQGPTDTPASPDTLSATLALIGQETLAARREVAAAHRDARQFEKELKELREAVTDAQRTLDALTADPGDTAMLAIAITADAATQGTLTLTHLVDHAGWAPVYDVHLDNLDAPSLRLDRSAYVFQDTGEDWQDVALTLSTSRPDGQSEPSELYAHRRWIEKMPTAKELADFAAAERMLSSEMGRMAEPVLEPAYKEESAAMSSDMDGLTATYIYPTPVSLVSSDEDLLRVALDKLTLTPDVYAFANPMRDNTAFLIAKAVNDTGELILPGYETNTYLNGSYIGQVEMPVVAKGGEFSLSFGALDGLRLTDVVTDRITGDKGVITSRNEQSETRVLTAENLTGRDWKLHLIGRVPYSEQEDLVISHSATPAPDETAYEDRRGILLWESQVAAGATFEVRLSHKLQWPTDMELR